MNFINKVAVQAGYSDKAVDKLYQYKVKPLNHTPNAQKQKEKFHLINPFCQGIC